VSVHGVIGGRRREQLSERNVKSDAHAAHDCLKDSSLSCPFGVISFFSIFHLRNLPLIRPTINTE